MSDPIPPAVILDKPQLADNIGAVARVMANFGLTDLRLVSPRDGWPQDRAWATASGADWVLEGVRVFDSVAEAIADLNTVFATTARPRETRQPGLTGHREVIAGLDLERGRALSVQLGDEPRQTSAQLGIRRRARRRDRATNASCGIRLTAHARLELVGAVAGEHQVRVTVDEPRDDGPPSGIHHVDIALGAVAGARIAAADPGDAAVLDEKIGVADQTGRVVGVIAQSRGVGGELADIREQDAGAHAPASIIGTVSPRSRATSRARS